MGTLTAVSYVGKGKWLWSCSCGEERVAQPYMVLKTGETATCGVRDNHAPASYYYAHLRVLRTKGKASSYECACGQPAKQWAYDHLDLDELYAAGMSANPMPFSMKPEHYVAMCVKCHKQSDMAYLRERH